jgi:SSS family solute:Na+ symporter
LSSVVRSNIIFAITFLVGGLVITFIGFYHLGGLDQFINRSNGKLVALLPADNNYLPWTSVFFGGLWVAQFYYFGCNQFITQYLLSGKTLTDAQKGVLFAATIKLIIPLIVIFPGIISFELLGDQLSNPDLAYPKLIEFLSKGLIGLKAVVFCMLVGAAVSSLNSMMIASANLFTNDIYLRYFNRSPSEKQVKMIGRSSTIIFIIIGCIWAPFIASFNGSFEYMQKFAGMISPGILTVFIIALYSQRTPSFVAIVILLLNIPIYECCFLLFPQWSFYDVIGITFLGLFITGIVLGNLFPLKTAVVMPENFNVKFERNLLVIIWSIFLITFIAFSYMLFL